MVEGKEKMEMTYEAYFRAIFGTMVDMFSLMEEEVGREEALKRISKFSEEKSIQNRKRIMEEIEIKDFPDFIEIYKRELDNPPYKNCLSYEIKEESDDRFCFEVGECLWARIFREMDAADIGYEVSCKPDLKVAPLYHPKVELKRTKTLMQGDECCDFEYSWDED